MADLMSELANDIERLQHTLILEASYKLEHIKLDKPLHGDRVTIQTTMGVEIKHTIYEHEAMHWLSQQRDSSVSKSNKGHSENAQDNKLDTILKRLIADIDDDMEFLGTMFNPKEYASKKVVKSLTKAKQALTNYILDQRIDDWHS